MASSMGSSKNDEKIVLSNLPLLFTDGYPTSLVSISACKLEKFIPFMLDCSLNREASCKDVMVAPPWWPADVEFRIPLVQNTSDRKWLFVLKRLVSLCYRYHKKTYMLSFCEKLSNTPCSELKFVDLHDGTTSLHKRDTGKLLVTFKNENRTYDRKTVSPRKYLLPPRETPIKAEPALLDIYLCDNCDAEFETLPEVRDHERVCQVNAEPGYINPNAESSTQNLRNATRPRLASPYHQRVSRSLFVNSFKTKEESSVEDLCATDQTRFLNVFSLRSGNSLGGFSKSNFDEAYISRCNGVVNQKSAIPISSPLGLLLLRKHSLTSKTQMQTHYQKIDHNCAATKIASNKPWRRMYRNAKQVNSEWTHLYIFNKKQRRERLLTINAGLDKRSRRLLKKCRPVKISLPRIPQSLIDEYKNKPSLATQDTILTSATEMSSESVSYDPSIPLVNIPANMLESLIHPMKTPPEESSDIELYEVFFRPQKTPANDISKILYYDVFYQPSTTPASEMPHYKGLIFLYKSHKKPTVEDLMAYGKGAPQSISVLTPLTNINRVSPMPEIKYLSSPPCTPRRSVKENPSTPFTIEKSLIEAHVTPGVLVTKPSVKVSPMVKAMKSAVLGTPTGNGEKKTLKQVEEINTQMQDELFSSTFKAFMRFVKENPNSGVPVNTENKKTEKEVAVTQTVQSSINGQCMRSTAKVNPIVQTVKTSVPVTPTVNVLRTPVLKNRCSSPTVQVSPTVRAKLAPSATVPSLVETPRRSANVSPAVQAMGQPLNLPPAVQVRNEIFQAMRKSGVKTPSPTIESLSQSEKEVVRVMRNAMSSRPVLEPENQYVEEMQMYNSLVPNTLTLHTPEIIPVIDLCSDEDEDVIRSPQQYQTPSNLPNTCVTTPYLQSLHQPKSSPGIKYGSATRTRWYERLPKATLTSENESMNCFPKLERRSEKWIPHKESGLHDQNRRLQ